MDAIIVHSWSSPQLDSQGTTTEQCMQDTPCNSVPLSCKWLQAGV